MNDTKNRLVSYSHLPDSNTSCVPAFATRLSQPINNEVEKPCSGTDGEKTQWKKEKVFPWINSFSKQCCAAVGNKNVKQLENLLNLYIQHVTPHYNECHKLPNKAFKLKRNINETMVFLHLLYSDLHEPLENGFYHEKMAEVMAMYLDLEITAFRRGKDTAREVYNRLSSSLYTLLDHSDEHLLDALLRTQLVNKHSKTLCSPFLRKVLTELVVCRPLSALTYVRYVLAFKLWKNVVADANEKKTINKIALQRVHPPPKFFQEHDIAKPLAGILPKVPKSKKNCSQFYLQAKLNLKDACRAFFRFCKETNCQEEPVYLPSFSEKTEEVESNGCRGLINEIWSTMSNNASDDMPLLGKSQVFSEDRMFCDNASLCESDEIIIRAVMPTKSCQKVESPDSGVCLDDRAKRKKSNDGELDKIPDSTDVMYPDSQELKRGGDESTDVDGSVAETISDTASPEPSSTVLGVSTDSNGESSTERVAGPDASSYLNQPETSASSVGSLTHQASFRQSPSSSVPCLRYSPEKEEVRVEVKIQNDSVELPSSSRSQQVDAPYPGAGIVSVEDFRSSETLMYQEVFRSEDQAEMEWRRYSDIVALSGNYKTTPDVSLDEQITTEDGDSRNQHSSSNCHLPLKKRKLAASSNESSSLESKPGYSSPFSESDYKTKVLELAIREEKRVGEDKYPPRRLVKCVYCNTTCFGTCRLAEKYKSVGWDPAARSRERELERLRLQACGGSEHEVRWRSETVPQNCAPADLSTHSPLRSCLERDLSQRRRTYEVFAAPEPRSSAQALLGAGKLDSISRSSSHAGTDAPDNLTILAEEAARIWEERAQGSGVPPPYVLLPSQANANYIPQGRMLMSIAEAMENANQKKMEESVIVRNDQYYKEESKSSGKVYINTQYHPGSNNSPEMSYENSQRRNLRVNGERPQESAVNPPPVKIEVVVNGSDCREHKPIDMSGKQNYNAGLPYSRSVNNKDVKPAVVGDKSICYNCESSVCKGKCRAIQGTLSRQQVPSVSVSCSNCRSSGCNGKKCKVASPSSVANVHQVEVPKKIYPSSSGEQKKYKRCNNSKNLSCDGTCKSASKNRAGSVGKVLNCAQCKSAQCNGSCRSNAYQSALCQHCKKAGCDSSRCLLAGIESKKCELCKSPTCKGKCKGNQNSAHKKSHTQEVHTYPLTKIAKCSYCKSTCFGTCRLAEKNQQVSTRCSLCNAVACKGKCATAAATCSFCSQKNCSGACKIHHSVDSILGSTSNASERPKRRRTRNSQLVEQSKPRTPVVQSAPESKRRKKSVSR